MELCCNTATNGRTGRSRLVTAVSMLDVAEGTDIQAFRRELVWLRLEL